MNLKEEFILTIGVIDTKSLFVDTTKIEIMLTMKV